MLDMVDYVGEVTVKKHGGYGSFEHLLFLLFVCLFVCFSE